MEKWSERLSTLDALFLELEDRTTHMHVGAVAEFEGKPPPYRDLLALIDARLDQPLGQGRPVWVDETQFDLEYHVRHTALPAPGGEEELKRLAGRLFSQALDRDKPLWEMWLVEGLGNEKGERFAIISKTHHCMLDGISGVDLATVLMDTEPSTNPPPPAAAWEPRPPPTTAELLVDSVKDQITHPLRVAKEALEANNDARKLLREIANGVRPILDLAGLGFAPPSALNRPIGPHRRFETLDLPLPTLRKIRRALGGSVNDVVLAMVAGALRSWLAARGETV
ncbi:MAG: wax ester/triacylglycerol synthase family O-acyltransferase, partial [Deltaproteobacteria bacterium]